MKGLFKKSDKPKLPREWEAERMKQEYYLGLAEMARSIFIHQPVPTNAKDLDTLIRNCIGAACMFYKEIEAQIVKVAESEKQEGKGQ